MDGEQTGNGEFHRGTFFISHKLSSHIITLIVLCLDTLVVLFKLFFSNTDIMKPETKIKEVTEHDPLPVPVPALFKG